ncbi:MAG: type IV pilus secretin PilQ [Pyrinomonadaceae bacterium]
MPAQLHTFAATRRGALVLSLVCLLQVFAFANAAAAPPLVTGVRTTNSGATTLITISGTAPLAYAVKRPDARTIIVELPGVDASRLAPNYAVTSPLVSGVSIERRSLPGAQPLAAAAVVRVNLLAPVRDRSQLADNDVVLELSPDNAQTPVRPAPTPAPVVPRAPIVQQPLPGSNAASLNTTPQTDQGVQYGQPGFVGEPADINVTNADIRDVLNYFTQQYGVNFVIDSSVGAVPVTINVSNVPWNVVLDSILKANRLGVEINGNLLRVATTEVLAGETLTRQRIRDSQLDNSPLVTEFIRLNYARASGTLEQTAGNTGGFAGGVVSGNGTLFGGQLSDVGAGNRAVSGKSADEGILPIIQRRLSRRGGIEVDQRSNTLIVTDVRENIQAVRQLVTLLDQPEPQVEIETRIVIADRNFSRDLGVQLNALAINTRTGGTAGLGTAPGSPGGAGGAGGNTIGLRPGGIPQGILNPSGALGANLPNTVIGLTTGIIGTAQISALITAAENKGQAKTIASPRVTALNNRPAQIESGSQIPVTTAQSGGAGGALLFTTTYVSVPLRLSVTPQITDVGTVILRVVAENNTVNRLIATTGAPGIDTQRMQSEVLVPDGGTTVIGGVLADTELQSQDRTPGVSSVPVLGNLFKRKLTTRSTREILFFITPRIYRPDFAGRPTSGTVSDGTRSTTIAQPVPLGNPSTNTPSQQPQPNTQPTLDNLPAQGGTTPAAAQPSSARPASRP